MVHTGTGVWPPSKLLRDTLKGLTIGVAATLISAALLAPLLALPAPGEDAARARCDQAVAALLESRDPVELQRADMLIRHLQCSVQKRLPS